MTQRDAPWWQTATGYQIYPRSFQDSNDDGIGDIPGILSRLDHLQELGIGFIWLSPVYASPMVDNGYDISDYRAIAPEFGTLDDLDDLIAKARARDIRIVMDLVVNHCSDQHKWFEKAKADPTSPEHDYFIWRAPGPGNGLPSKDRSYFGGPMWTWVPEVGKYYLHQFAPGQPDLNWQNPALRAEIYDMMNWWFDRGIGGFRMDVIDLIGKDVDNSHFIEGPYLHEFLQEMHRETLTGRDVLTVGESWGVSPETALLYCGRGRAELDTVFQFSHVMAGWHPEHGKWHPLPLDLPKLKSVLFEWQDVMADDGWNALFWSNHDLPRAVSKHGDDGRWRVRSAKALALALHGLRGTPYVYQGEEIGMTNVAFDRLDQFRDIETFGMWEEARIAGRSEADFIAGANANGRDNARTPVQWDAGPQAGFTDGTPWIDVNPNFKAINVADDTANPNGIFYFYQKLIQLRRVEPVLTDGRFIPILVDHPQVFAYLRQSADATLVVLVNLSSDEVGVTLPDIAVIEGDLVAATTTDPDPLSRDMVLEPYEGIATLARITA
ncbi:MAG: alpha-glucosidase [Pseudomonadota bacterium]